MTSAAVQGVDTTDKSVVVSGAPARYLNGLTMSIDMARYGLDVSRGWVPRVSGHDISRFRCGTRRFVCVTHPEYIDHVLHTGRLNYHKSFEYELLRALLGVNLFTDEDESWQWHRTLLNPMFAKRRLNGLVDLMVAPIDDLVAEMKSKPDATELSLSDAMVKLTLNVVGNALFGKQFGAISDEMSDKVTTGLRFGEKLLRLFLIVEPPRRLFRIIMRGAFLSIPLPWPFRTMQIVAKSLDKSVWDLVRDRKTNPTNGLDLLNYMLTTEDEDGKPLPLKRVRDESMTFMLAGHETTANALSWMWYLLALNPPARDRMLKEVDDVLEGRTPTADDLAQLPWTTACFMEAMRFYSPAWIIPRLAIKDDVVGGHHIRKGTTVILPGHLVHHDERWWPNPGEFDPSRFLPGAGKGRSKSAYLPFGGGKRICIGQSFAVMESVLVTAILSQNFVFDLRPGHPVDPEATLTLRPRHGLQAIARRRHTA
ncbi:cytochrome P450 [Mycobacteroides chelonae]|uniref:cytochrome P450 n=2 Tax=Mycobacteroides chelonae TaxID=1774 RepID=UPI0009A36B37|nr:cytochrome P450 [Mycobacteroides chelonae]